VGLRYGLDKGGFPCGEVRLFRGGTAVSDNMPYVSFVMFVTRCVAASYLIMPFAAGSERVRFPY